MNERYVVDAYAWIEYFVGSRSGEKVKAVLEDGDNEIFTCAVTVAEVVSKICREGRDFETAYDVVVSDSQVVNVDEEVSKEAGVLHSEMRKTRRDFGLADAYVLAVARRTKSRILTGDVHFKGVREAILI
jgi:predicted nucleic acid-binding protein